MDVIFALITALAFGFDYFFVRKGLMAAPYPLPAAFITLTVNTVFFLALFYFYVPVELLKGEFIYPFIVAGVLAPGCARLFSYQGLEKLGVAIAAPIVNSETLFSVLMAIIFLKEKVNSFIVLGILCTISGVAMLSYETGKAANGGKVPARVHYLYIFYPVAAAACYGISVFFRKFGLMATGSPVLGAAVTSATSWLILAALIMTGGQARVLGKVGKSGLGYFFLGGAMTCIAWFFMFAALNIGRVSLVGPIVSCCALVSMFLSYMFLRKVERLTLMTVSATCLVVGGVTLLILGR